MTNIIFLLMITILIAAVVAACATAWIVIVSAEISGEDESRS